MVRRLVQKFKRNNQQVIFASKPTVIIFHKRDDVKTITYDLGADHHYMRKADRIGLGLPILKALKKPVGVANGGTSKGKYVTSITFPQFSNKATESDTFEKFRRRS